MVILFDQVTKAYTRHHLLLGEKWPSGWPAHFSRVENSGSAFGLFTDQTIFLVIASVLAIGIMLYFYRQVASAGWLIRLSLGMQFGGAVSNLADRIRDGHVTDMIHLPRWPDFNVADSSVVIGILILAAVIFFTPESPEPRT
ncbi:MAG: signal peptidase II [Chloroflexi bacterium]|nr:signal peptidase II [Chloroflexota bacterium]